MPASRPRLLTRRELTVAGAGLVLAAQVPDAWGKRLLERSAKVGPGRFLDGVASGDPSATTMVFWSRLTTEHQRSGARLVVATDEGLTNTVATAVVPTTRGNDGALKVRVTGLAAGTVYYYAWHSADEASDVGRTKTLNPPDSAAPLRVAYSSCQNWPQGFFNAHLDAAAGDPLDLYVFLGDYTYEYGPSSQFRRDGSASVDLQTYRDKLRLYRTDAGLRELHRRQPVAHVWDDHEVANNYTDNNPRPSDLQRNAAYKASFEWLPRMAAGGERYRLYRSYRLGATAELFMLDERQYRTGDGDGLPRQMLGRPQMDWLKGALASSTARWKLIGNPTMFSPLSVAGKGRNTDQWDGYRADRDELLGLIAGIGDVVFLSGDAHTFFTSHVLRHHGTDGPSIATEFVAGSISSRGLPGFDGATAQQVTSASPWITFVDGDDHGYGTVECNPAAARITYKAAGLDAPGRPSRVLAIYDQQAGANDYVTSYQEPSGSTPPETEAAGRQQRLPAQPSARSLSSAHAPTPALARRRRREERLVRKEQERTERAAHRRRRRRR